MRCPWQVLKQRFLKKEPAANSQVQPQSYGIRNLRGGIRQSVSHRALQGIWLRAPLRMTARGKGMDATDRRGHPYPRHSDLLYHPHPLLPLLPCHTNKLSSLLQNWSLVSLEYQFLHQVLWEKWIRQELQASPPPPLQEIVSLLSSY